MSTEDKLEVWKNTSAGMRWVKTHDRAGNEATKLVQGGRSFAILPFDRQVNQDMAASPGQDLFRNGTFVLVKASKDTNEDEIESPDSLTDNELYALSMEIQGTPEGVAHFTRDITSPIALNRLVEQLVLDEAPKDAVAYVKSKAAEASGDTQVEAERVQVTEPPKKEEVKTPRGGIPEAETPEMVRTTPETIGG